MNIKDQTNHIIYYNNLKLAEIRANIEDQMKRIDNEIFVETDSHSLAELHDLRAQLEEFYNKLDSFKPLIVE